jgi:hypothetical protein
LNEVPNSERSQFLALFFPERFGLSENTGMWADAAFGIAQYEYATVRIKEL